MSFILKHNKYLLLIPVLLLVFNAFYFRFATAAIRDALLEEKYEKVVQAVEMLASSVEAYPDIPWFEHEKHIIASVEHLDKQYQIYGGAYKYSDGELGIITTRYFETSIFEPLDYPEFTEMALTQDSGSMVIGYTPDFQGYRDLHLYFRWMPLYSGSYERYLVIAGVSYLSITAQVSELVTIGQMVSMIATFLLNVALIVALNQLGEVWGQRAGDKWRSRER